MCYKKKGCSNLDKNIAFTGQVSTLMKIKCSVMQQNLCWDYKMDHNMLRHVNIFFTPHKYLLTAHMFFEKSDLKSNSNMS